VLYQLQIGLACYKQCNAVSFWFQLTWAHFRRQCSTLLIYSDGNTVLGNSNYGKCSRTCVYIVTEIMGTLASASSISRDLALNFKLQNKTYCIIITDECILNLKSMYVCQCSRVSGCMCRQYTIRTAAPPNFGKIFYFIYIKYMFW
jgi:hypothetical protein